MEKGAEEGGKVKELEKKGNQGRRRNGEDKQGKERGGDEEEERLAAH